MEKKNPRANYINDEAELPSLTKDFASNVKKHFAEKDAKDSSQKKQFGSYGASLVSRIKERHPRLTEEEIEDMLDHLA